MHQYLLVSILYTSIMSPLRRLYAAVGKSNWTSRSWYDNILREITNFLLSFELSQSHRYPFSYTDARLSYHIQCEA